MVAGKGRRQFPGQSRPVAWEEHLTDRSIAEHPKLFVADTNDARITVVTQLVAPWRRPAAGGAPLSFRATLIDRLWSNAFALPGGRIFVFKGLLDRVQKPEELAGVLAHEMAPRHATAWSAKTHHRRRAVLCPAAVCQ